VLELVPFRPILLSLSHLRLRLVSRVHPSCHCHIKSPVSLSISPVDSFHAAPYQASSRSIVQPRPLWPEDQTTQTIQPIQTMVRSHGQPSTKRTSALSFLCRTLSRTTGPLSHCFCFVFFSPFPLSLVPFPLWDTVSVYLGLVVWGSSPRHGARHILALLRCHTLPEQVALEVAGHQPEPRKLVREVKGKGKVSRTATQAVNIPRSS
jgi:hypothetical protein